MIELKEDEKRRGYNGNEIIDDPIEFYFCAIENSSKFLTREKERQIAKEMAESKAKRRLAHPSRARVLRQFYDARKSS